MLARTLNMLHTHPTPLLNWSPPVNTVFGSGGGNFELHNSWKENFTFKAAIWVFQSHSLNQRDLCSLTKQTAVHLSEHYSKLKDVFHPFPTFLHIAVLVSTVINTNIGNIFFVISAFILFIIVKISFSFSNFLRFPACQSQACSFFLDRKHEVFHT